MLTFWSTNILFPTGTCAERSEQTTLGGTGSGLNCCSKWRYKGQEQTGCIVTPDKPDAPWCAVHSDYDQTEAWGYCTESCEHKTPPFFLHVLCIVCDSSTGKKRAGVLSAKKISSQNYTAGINSVEGSFSDHSWFSVWSLRPDSVPCFLQSKSAQCLLSTFRRWRWLHPRVGNRH